MRRKITGALGGLALVAIGGVAAASALSAGGTTSPAGPASPDYATVKVDLRKSDPAGSQARRATKKPKLVYLKSSTPTTVDPADPPAGVGPYVDVGLTGCSKVIDGNVVPSRGDVYVQGGYVESRSEYHVLIGLDKDSLGDRTPFTVSTSLICLKGVK